MNSFIAVLEKKVVSYMCFKGKHVEKKIAFQIVISMKMNCIETNADYSPCLSNKIFMYIK